MFLRLLKTADIVWTGMSQLDTLYLSQACSVSLVLLLLPKTSLFRFPDEQLQILHNRSVVYVDIRFA